nr:hypothetical protein [uncultured Acetatifactor sp.]
MKGDIEQLFDIPGHIIRLDGFGHTVDIPVSHADVQMLLIRERLQGLGKTLSVRLSGGFFGAAAGGARKR